jgi:hypothetical protein
MPTTPLGWALRARLIAEDLSEWWDDYEMQEDEARLPCAS